MGWLHCDTPHARKVDGEWVRGARDLYQLVVAANGIGQIRVRCADCNQPCGFLPRDVWRNWQAAGAVLSGGQVNAPTVYPPCSYKDCDIKPTEYHHFAPYNTFGNDADSWPYLPLCREHHHQWHRTMDGYRWHRRGIWRDAS